MVNDSKIVWGAVYYAVLEYWSVGEIVQYLHRRLPDVWRTAYSVQRTVYSVQRTAYTSLATVSLSVCDKIHLIFL